MFSALVVKVFQLNGRLLAIGDALAEPAGQTSARWQVLAAIEDEALSVADIARALGLARQSVQRVADVLEGEGLAVYDDNPAHARAKLLRLTATGRRALATIKTAQIEWANRVGARVGRAQLERTVADLERVLEALSESE